MFVDKVGVEGKKSMIWRESHHRYPKIPVKEREHQIKDTRHHQWSRDTTSNDGKK